MNAPDVLMCVNVWIDVARMRSDDSMMMQRVAIVDDENVKQGVL